MFGQNTQKKAVMKFTFLVKLQAWRLGTPSQMFFSNFRQRFRNTSFVAVKVNTSVYIA